MGFLSSLKKNKVLISDGSREVMALEAEAWLERNDVFVKQLVGGEEDPKARCRTALVWAEA